MQSPTIQSIFFCDPDEKEISDNDDDDRNHKHRRRDTEAQSSDKDSLEQALTQPYRKRNRPFQNGQGDFQSQNPLNRDFSKRRLTGTNFTRQFGEPGNGRGRGRGGYFQRETRFGSIDVASQMVHQASIPPSMFSGRGLPVPNAQSASWSGFGLVPTIPNGSINAINPLGLQGILGPQMNPSMNMGIQRQRCRDFEERGFCLRGDMCPMEHGVNRIVVEDVQSLSQFNLPVSLPSAQILGPSAGNGFISSADVSSSLINSRGPHSLTDISSVDEEVLAGATNAGGTDVYDPDQPLWNNDAHETSTPMLGLHSSGFDETVSFMDADLSDHAVRSRGDFTAAQSTSSSVWGRLRNSKNKLEPKEKFDARTKAPEFPAKETCEPSSVGQGNFHVGKQNNGALFGSKSVMTTSKLQNAGGTVRKSSQKAHRTLFVNCIPLKDNKRENLLSHFRKFGEVIDIYIPANSERAFVQFSKREEAEKALKAPDAVMGSRFIKLWWANRDSIADNDVSSPNNASISPQDVMAASGSTHPAVISKGKINVQHAAPKVVTLKPPGGSVTASNDLKLVNSPKPAPPAQKKMESLEVMKEQLRKKQEMLEQKRREFRQKLDKLTKQTSGKIEVPAELAEMRQASETPSNASKGENTQPLDAGISKPSPKALTADKIVMENLASNRANVNSAGALLDPLILKQQPIHPIATSGRPSYINRYKLDNRPTTFRIHAPLPVGLTNVAVLRDHFSLYGEISNLEVEDSYEEQSPNNLSDSEGMRNCSVRVSFATRPAAERAFLNGKSWHGQNLQFSWVTSTSSILVSSRSSGESSSALRGTSNIEVQSSEKTVNDETQNAMEPTESNSSPPKSSNELSCDSSRSNGERNSPAQKHSHPEVQSPHKSTGHVLLEADELENRNSEGLEEESGDDLKLDENLEAG
ncbi:zinc finger CCCH domain-containing protein 41 isoform X2 [Silene latifolia]|uniref:zinc finger CCCH domain-containing protein 41 isoform X2 n=1 Tax=Silene latifolia TaxID=37657 RepID=UPI003D77F581